MRKKVDLLSYFGWLRERSLAFRFHWCVPSLDPEKYGPSSETYEITDSATSKYALRTSHHALLLECE